MKNEFVGGKVWKKLKKFARQNKRAAHVAVPYFGKGGAALLPLPPRSVLVVNASDANIKAHRVCPNDLLTLQQKGVKIYDCPDLHAKVYTFSQRVYLGSANVSQNARDTLIETFLCTTDKDVVEQARQFVLTQCHRPLGPERLTQMQRLYDSHKGRGWNDGIHRRTLPRVCLAQLSRENWTRKEKQEAKHGAKAAEGERIHTSGWVVDCFHWMGQLSFRKEDSIMQVTTEPDGTVMVSRPGELIYVHAYPTRRGTHYFIYVEVPQHRRRSSEQLAKLLGRGGKALLECNGVVRKRSDAARLLRVWGV